MVFFKTRVRHLNTDQKSVATGMCSRPPTSVILQSWTEDSKLGTIEWQSALQWGLQNVGISINKLTYVQQKLRNWRGNGFLLLMEQM